MQAVISRLLPGAGNFPAFPGPSGRAHRLHKAKVPLLHHRRHGPTSHFGHAPAQLTRTKAGLEANLRALQVHGFYPPAEDQGC